MAGTLLLFLFFLHLTGVRGTTEDEEGGGDAGGGDGAEDPVDAADALRLDYTELHWCHAPRLVNGELSCHSPRGRPYRTTRGTRCNMSCDRGYRLVGQSSIHCLANRRWSGTAVCRKMRCSVLPLIPHGRYSCTQGFVVDSRCDFTCAPGRRIEGEHSRTCRHGGTWSGVQPICSDTEPPKIRCPRSKIKVAEAGKLTARVTWDAPVATDTADKTLDVILVGQEPGTDFKEGPNIVRYKVYDQARNRAACKFIIRVEVRRCPALSPPMHGSLTCSSSDDAIYGSTCDYLCDAAYERRGEPTRVCQFDRSWSAEPAECVPMAIEPNVQTASALLRQFFQKRRLLILSAPDVTDPEYQLQNVMIQKAECGLELRHVTLIELLGSPPDETGRIKENNLTSAVIDELRMTFRISRQYFSMVLVDKMGLDRERFINPLPSEELFSYIDSFVLDEDEREKLDLHSEFCSDF